MPYIIVILILFFLYLFSLRNNTSKYISEKMSFFIILVFVGLRYETGGPDWISYESFFSGIEPLNEVMVGNGDFFWGHGFEFGFKLFSSSIKVFTDNYLIMNLVAEFIVLISVYGFFKDKTSHLILCIIVYFSSVSLLGDMTVVRQMLAVSMFVFSLKYIDKSIVKTILFMSLAMSFHYASAICLMFFVIYYLRSSIKLLYSIALFSILISIPFGGITSILLEVLSSFSSFGFAVKLKLAQYTQEFSESKVSVGIGTLERLLLCGLIILFFNRMKEKFGSIIYIPLSLYLCNLFLSAFFSDMPAFYLRFRYFFIFSTPMVFIFLLSLIRQKWIIPIVVLSYSSLWAYMVISANKNQYLPYQNYINVIYGADLVERRELLDEQY